MGSTVVEPLMTRFPAQATLHAKKGVMAIKAIARQAWGDQPKTNTTWYQPFTDREAIQAAVNFALSLEVSGVCTAGDVSLLPLVLQACENFTQLSPEEQEALIQSGKLHEPLFA
jgi:hypothetical protein